MNHPPAIEELLRQIQAGDEQALLTLHARYVNLVYSVAYQVLQDPMAAEEVTQDTFMRLPATGAGWSNPLEPERAAERRQR